MKSIRSFLVPVLLIAFGVALFSVFPPKDAHANTSPSAIYSKVIDLASQADGVGSTNVVPAPSAVLGDACIASASLDLQDMTISCYIQAAGLAEVRVQNESGGTIDLASATFRVYVHPAGTR
jgi:hypothetical protein